MDFMKMIENDEKSVTENGAVGFKTSGSKLVDLNFQVPSFRKTIDKDLFKQALNEDEKLTLKWLLYLRDVREGIGERKSFRDFVLELISYDVDLANIFIKEVDIAEYGRWDDYVDIAYRTDNDFIRNMILDKIDKQLVNDMQDMDDKKSVSLLAKWLPSINASSKETCAKAKMICNYLGMLKSEYRKILSELRAYIDVVERKMSENEWGEIDYSAVPSKANVNYRNAFERHDGERREKYLESLKKGETKINANAMFLHDIVHAYAEFGEWCAVHKDYDETLEQLWKAQDKCNGFSDTVVVRDGSGSMTVPVDKSGLTALEVADAITLYCAENNEGAFKDKFITFSSWAKLIDVSHLDNLHDKLKYLAKYDDISSTNIESVFDLILDTAVKNGVSQEDMPKTVLIVSDMEFNMAQGYYNEKGNKALFETIAEKYKKEGYKLPKLVFWNVNSRTNTVPLTQNENGVILISGFSKNLMDMVMSSELDPYKALVKQLNLPRYEIVDKIFEIRVDNSKKMW
jgi:hypothetical protein|uniref:DUF2828 family protein n=1 Tax=Myoviridae sp. ctqfO1 TaxID=2827710 RepID=A0A8S5T2L1_9CAUD|nr:MAG TPA: protein of unknown function (DUF2828) [Myoviridae sp. ctqfO1]